MRMMLLGATILTDDVFLMKHGAIIPFVMKMHVKGDFALRFRLAGYNDGSEVDLHQHLYQGPPLTSVNKVIFPHVHHTKESRLTSLTAPQARAQLNDIYLEETHFNAYPIATDQQEEQCNALVNNADCFNFYAGTDETLAKETLERLCQ